MSVSRRISVHRLAVAFVGLSAAALSGLGAQAQAATSSTSTAPTTVSRSTAAARASAPVRAPTISSELLRATGHGASQLTARAACGSAVAGRIRCYARVLTVKSTGEPASLLRVPHASASVTHASSATTAPQQYTAGFLQWAYDTTWLSANRGTSDTVAIVDAYGDSTAYSDMEQFRSGDGLPQIPTCGGSVTASCFEVVNQNGQTTNLPTDANDETDSWNIEESLDIDAVSSICPLCKILVVEAKSDDDHNHPDLETAVSEAATLGANQISLSWGADVTPDASDYSSPYSSITSSAILAAAGDDTYPGPDVGYPAALPNVTAVGGTSLAADATSARGFDESAWSVETCSGGTPCATESGCDTSQSIPPYQQGVTTDCDGRAYNDISADADPETGLEIYDSQSGDEGCGTSNNWCIVGGTSLATPLTAAFEAITSVPSATTPAWTYSSPYSSLLNDIVSGSDGSCSGVICNAGTGWDGPTGNGSIDGEVVSGVSHRLRRGPPERLLALSRYERVLAVRTDDQLRLDERGGQLALRHQLSEHRRDVVTEPAMHLPLPPGRHQRARDRVRLRPHRHADTVDDCPGKHCGAEHQRQRGDWTAAHRPERHLVWGGLRHDLSVAGVAEPNWTLDGDQRRYLSDLYAD
jgi:hypothetical protein